MILDEQLRAALKQEAEMRNTPRPDIDRLISGGRARRRRRNVARIGVVAAAVVLAGGGAYGVAQVDRGGAGSYSDIANQPTQPSESPTPPPRYYDGGDLPGSGTYRKVVGSDASSGALIEADLTFEDPGWYGGAQPVLSGASGAAGVGVFQAQALPGRSGCVLPDSIGNAKFREAATTADALARQLAQLPSSAVVQPPTPTRAFGYDASELRLRIDAACPSDRVYMVAEASTGDLGVSYDDSTEVVVDALVVDVEGTPIVVALWHNAGASREQVDEATRVRDSITFVPREPTS